MAKKITRIYANSLAEMLENSVKNYPKQTALIFGSKKITYAHLYNTSLRLAQGLKNKGIGKDDKVCLWLHNGVDFVYSYFALIFLGAVVVPVNTMFRREEVKHLIQDSSAKALIVSVDKVDDATVLRSRIEDLEHIIAVPRVNRKEDLNVDNFYDLIRENQPLNDKVYCDYNSVAQILYTSGTTGAPKGACLTHRNLISNVRDCLLAIEVTSKDKALCFLPMFHSFASTVCMLLPISAGATIVIMRTIRPFKRLIRAVFKNKVTLFVGIPSLYNILANHNFKWHQLFLAKVFNPIRVCISGAAALPKETINNFQKKFKRPLLEGYGLTETSPVVSLNPLNKKRKIGSVGLPLHSVRVKIIDKEGNDLSFEQEGELLVQGPNVMQGYFRMEEETKKTIKDGWLYTGDIAKIDKEGYIYIMGRAKEMINVRGLNVYPKEIEEALYKHPAVKEAAVVGVLHKHRGEVPVAFIVKEDEPINEREFIKYLRKNIASYKVPLKVIFKENLPKNSTGKILKRVLWEEIKGIFK